ncbi:MAG TPA: acyl-CoA dehydrogenase [Mycobacteriales bacterium]|jgi:alkylation response protein AidB-like acyl-CoA dehydrogenase|nr:acyl-CoA dehydrogenase [Mycobacteriales bacterium]
MDLTYPPEATEFRQRIQAFLADNLPKDWKGAGALPPEERTEFEHSWRRTLADNHLLAVNWPKEYGGAGLSPIEQVVVAEEFAKAGAPQGTENDVFGIGMLGNTLIVWGTEEQKKHYLPRILSGEDKWCQGYSEPDAGSDLAGLRTRAVLDGDEWVINGQKIWTSAGHLADWIFVLARTDPDAPKHRGISFFLVPMDQPGVEVRPIRNAAGYAMFNEVFFTDARTPKANVVGEINNGWVIAMTLLGFERGAAVTTDAIRWKGDVERLLALAKERGVNDDPKIREQLAWCYSRVEVMRYRGLQALTRFLKGGRPGADAAISKIIWSEFFQRYTELAMEIIGEDIIAPSGPGSDALQVSDFGTPNSPLAWVDSMMHARSATIYAGSSQIQRNIIGEQLLGLPKEPRLDAGPFKDIAAARG